MTHTEKLLRELIALPSVNPAFLPVAHPNAGEARMSDFLAAIAAKAGLDIEFRPALPNRPNLLARLSPRGQVRTRVLLAPHLDTVDATPEQFQPRRSGRRLFGRGACDTKGSVAAMMAALCELARGSTRPQHTELIFVGLVDEENGQGGSRALAAEKFPADLAIVGEPTELKVVTAHKGTLWLDLETRGKAAHGARPELGRNAVHAMARVVDLLETEYASALKRRRHRLLGRATINVGAIAGGTQPNIVPDRCVIQIDRRTLPGETEAGIKREIRGILRREGLSVRFLPARHGPSLPLETNARLPLVRQLLQNAGQTRPSGVDYFCDASILARGGIPSVAFGPGNIAQAHTVNEWIELASLEGARSILTRFLRSLP